MVPGGAPDDSAPLEPAAKPCKTVDQYLAPLDAEVAAGRLQHIGRIVREDLDRSTLRAVVRLVIDVVRALPPDALPSITARLDAPGAGSSVIPLVVALLEPLPGDPKAVPPKPPRTAELAIFSNVATTCLSPGLFATATEVLRDPRLEPILKTLLAGAGGLGEELEKALAAAGFEGRDAIVALLRNVALSIARPDFDPVPLVAMLDGLAGSNASLAALADLLRVLALDDKGAARVANVQTLSAFVGCFVDLDAEFVLPGYWYDIFASGALGQALAATPTDTADPDAPDTRADDQLAATMAVLELLSYATQVLTTSEPARDALGQIGALILRPDLAVEAIPEVLRLLQSGALDGLPGLLSDIAAKPCLAKAPQ